MISVFDIHPAIKWLHNNVGSTVHTGIASGEIYACGNGWAVIKTFAYAKELSCPYIPGYIVEIYDSMKQVEFNLIWTYHTG